MKEIIWRFLVAAIQRFPRSLRGQLCRLLFAASSQGESSAACKDLLGLEESLNWHINNTALRYGNGVHPKHRLMGYHQYFAERLKSGERVLDIGCGYGALAESMSKAGAIVTGIDINSKSIEQARQRYSTDNLSFIEGDAGNLVFSQEFETIVMSNVLEHIKDRIGLILHLKTSLNPDRFLIRVPLLERNWKVYFRKDLGMFYYSDPTHYTEYTVDSFGKEMEEAGLRIVNPEIRWGELYAELYPTGIDNGA